MARTLAEAAAVPGHIIAKPGDDRALCGVRNPLPVTAAKAVQGHIDGHNPEWCASCLALWRGLPVEVRAVSPRVVPVVVPEGTLDFG